MEANEQPKPIYEILFKISFKGIVNQSRQRDLIILLGVSLISRIATAAVVTQPGYPDPAYYFDVAKNLASGHGFTEDFIFTYLTPAKSVVHPSNLYWMPLTSIVIAPFLALFGTSWHIAQIPIILLSVSLPLLAYWIGWDIFQSRRYALAIGLFTLIGGSIYPYYLVSTNTIALYGSVSLLALIGMYQGWRGHPWRFALAGIAIGLAHLTRTDGVLLLLVGGIVWLCSQKKRSRTDKSSETTRLHPIPWQALLGMYSFYLLTMAPWFIRNIELVGSPLPTWATTTIWFTNYSDFFSFHKTISPQAYLAWGLGNILRSKVQVLTDIFLFLNTILYIPIPFVILGMWIERKRAELLPFLIYLVLLYGILSLVFSFPSIHGTFFQSLIGLLPPLYGWAIAGIDATIIYINKLFGAKKENERRAMYLTITILMAIAVVLSEKTILDTAATWNQNYPIYQKIGEIVANDYRENRKLHNSVQPLVMVSNAADYYYVTGQHAVLLPAQDLSTILDVAQSYSVSYILFNPDLGIESPQFWQTTLTDSRLKLIWASSSEKLYRFLPVWQQQELTVKSLKSDESGKGLLRRKSR